MTIKEQLTEAKAELVSLKADIEAEDDDAMARAAELVNDIIPELEKAMEKSNQAAELLGKIGEPAEEVPAVDEPKSMGEMAVKSFVGMCEKGTRFSVSTPEMKTDPATMTGVQIADLDKNVVEIQHPLEIADLFGTETIQGNAITYYVLTDGNGNITPVAENGAKPMVDYVYTPVTVSLTKVAGYIKESDEILEDAQWLTSAIENRLLYKLKQVEEAQLISGNGTAPNVKGILNVSGIGSVTYQTAISADDVFKAIMKVKQDSGFDADAIIINPSDYQTFRLAKDSNNQYYGGGYFGGAYGNGTLQIVAPLWGVRTVLSTAVTAGTVLVGAFKQGASVIRKGGIRLEATNSEGNDFTYNRVTVRAEERLALACRYPQAFVKVAQA